MNWNYRRQNLDAWQWNNSLYNEHKKLTKRILYALRHSAKRIELEMSPQGWVSIDELAKAINRPKASVMESIENDNIQRFSLSNDGRVKSNYGHGNWLDKILYEEAEPPPHLHVLSNPNDQITTEGILPSNRQYVHLSSDLGAFSDYERTRRRSRNRNGHLLRCHVRTQDSGIKFYKANDVIWLADKILPAMIVK